jgi:hypothetical protein
MSLRLFLAAIALTTSLAACSDDGSDDEASDDGPGTTSAPSEQDPATTDAPSDGPTTSAGVGEVSAEFCDAARRVDELDDESERIMTDVQANMQSEADFIPAWEAALVELDALVAELEVAYQDMIEHAPEGLAADVTGLMDGTLVLMEGLQATGTIDDLAAYLDEASTSPDVAEMVDATIALDEITQAECDVTLVD